MQKQRTWYFSRYFWDESEFISDAAMLFLKSCCGWEILRDCVFSSKEDQGMLLMEFCFFNSLSSWLWRRLNSTELFFLYSLLSLDESCCCWFMIDSICGCHVCLCKREWDAGRISRVVRCYSSYCQKKLIHLF